MTKKNWSRRGILKIGGASALALGATSVIAQSVGNLCAKTPKQPEGPFYPVRDQADKNTDLTLLDGHSDMALGDIIYISGKVLDQNCVPTKNVVIEIWQACASGRYNHPGDEDNPRVLDNNFQYWGITTSGEDGSYSFKTIKPGHYDAGPNWVRPPHIHFKIHKRGYEELITQMYFAGNEYNNADLLLQRLGTLERAAVVRDLQARIPENGRNTYNINFDITITKII